MLSTADASFIAVTEQAFAVSKSVFLEKPIALSAEDANAILAAAERSREEC